jgi:cation diffusion facilitator family transporter
MDDEFREKGGKKAALTAIIANCFLTVLNIGVGVFTGSSAFISEGAHTLSDIISTVIAYIGFRYGQKPADFKYPMGYARVEALSGLFIVVFLVIVSWEILEKASKQILFNQYSAPDIYVAIIAVVGIIVNLLASRYIIKIGTDIRSPAIIADGQHQRADVFTSVAILVGVLVSNMGYPILDPILAIIIGLIIIRTAIKIFIENVNHIVGRIPSEDFIEQIKDVANSVPQAQNAHAVKINNMGSYSTVSLHISLDEDTVLKESHKIAHDVQDKIMSEIPEIKYVTVHTCPLGEEYNHKQEIDG